MESLVNYSFLRFTFILSAVALSASAWLPAPGFAQEDEAITRTSGTATPNSFVRSLLEELQEISAEAGDERDARLRSTLLRNMAVSRMQAYLIRGDIEGAGSEAEISEYNEIFPEYIAAAIGGSIDRMVDRRIDVGEARENKRRPGDYIVPAKVFSDAGEERATLGWRIRTQRGELLLTDFTIDGQSFTVERKAQFTALVRNRGFSELLVHMRDVIDD